MGRSFRSTTPARTLDFWLAAEDEAGGNVPGGGVSKGDGRCIGRDGSRRGDRGGKQRKRVKAARAFRWRHAQPADSIISLRT